MLRPGDIAFRRVVTYAYPPARWVADDEPPATAQLPIFDAFAPVEIVRHGAASGTYLVRYLASGAMAIVLAGDLDANPD